MSEQRSQDPPTFVGAPTGWSAAGPAPSPNVQATMHQMTEQLQTVIDAAERAAEAIRYDAEEQARRHLAEAQRKADRLTAERVGLISELTDDLVRHAANVRDHSEQMVRALEDAISSVTDKLEQPGMTDPFAGAMLLPVPEAASGTPPLEDAGPSSPQPAPPPPFEPGVAAGSYSDIADAAATAEIDAFIHATRLAAAGEDRETIAVVLQHRFGLVDTDSIIDRVLGDDA